ncbi:MAG: exonuclease SbcCD subunit D [Thermoproteales archaeon]|nr:exonuclease SbcCD subunit D [Thermoproteales archaeon]
MVFFAHISDTHLGFRQYNLREREQDFYDAFNEAIDKIIKEKVDFVVHSGDLFESSRPSTEALLAVLKSVKKLDEKGIKIYAIPGSHDQPRRKGLPPHALFEQLGVTVLRSSKPFDVFGKKVFIGGVEYTPRAFKKILKSKIEEIASNSKNYSKRILVLHQAVQQYLPFDYELDLSDLPTNFDYYAMGHIHKRLKTNYGRGILAYPGSTEVWSKDEYNEYRKNGKGFYIVDLSGDQPYVHEINLENIRPHLEFKVKSSENFDKEFAKIMEKIRSIRFNKKPVIHLEIKTSSSINRVFLQKLISKYIEPYALGVRWQLEEKPLTPDLLTLEMDKISIKDLLREFLKDESKASFAYELFNLLSQGDIEGAVNQARRFYEKGAWK